MQDKYDRMQEEYEKRLKKQRKNVQNWTMNEGYTIKKAKGFTIKHGNYIKGEYD